MLACRPMLLLATAIMAGALTERRFLLLTTYWPIALAICLAAIAWFALTPPIPLPPPPDTLPESYQAHIMPVPGIFAQRGLNRFMLILGLFTFVAGMAVQHHWRSKLDPARLPFRNAFTATLVVRAPSHAYPGQAGTVSVPATLTAVDGTPITHVPVRFRSEQPASFRRGDIIRGRVRIWRDSPTAYPGAFDFSFFRERDGLAGTISAVGRVKNTSSPLQVFAVDAPSPPMRIRRALDAIRAKAIEKTLANGGEYGGLLAAMLFGYRQEVGDVIREAFRRVGIGHVLAISGLHVGLVVFILWRLGGWIGLSSRRRAVLCLLLAVFFWSLTGGQTAATRATLMAGIHLAGIAWGSRADMLNSLGAAAFFITLANPSAPLDVSFQLSFIAVVFIYTATHSARGAQPRRVGQRHPGQGPGEGLLQALRRDANDLVRLSVATWIGLFPVIAIVFHQVNPGGLPINIFVIPLMSAVLACGLLVPWIGWLPGVGWLLTRPTWLLTVMARMTDALPGSSFPAHPPGTVWVVLFYLAFACVMMRPIVRNPRIGKSWNIMSWLGLGICFVGILLSMRTLPPPEKGRVSLLPGSGFGMIVAEAPNGDMALIGGLKRGGVNEAGWLHYLHRKGRVAGIEIGKANIKSLETLSWHYPIGKMSSIPLSRKAEAGTVSEWMPVPGAEGVEYGTARDGKGRLFWMAVRAGEAMVAVTPRIGTEEFEKMISTKEIPGSGAGLFSVRFSDPEGDFLTGKMGRRRIAVKGRIPDGLRPGAFRRDGFGVLVVSGGITGYDGRKWRNIAGAPDLHRRDRDRRSDKIKTP